MRSSRSAAASAAFTFCLGIAFSTGCAVGGGDGAGHGMDAGHDVMRDVGPGAAGDAFLAQDSAPAWLDGAVPPDDGSAPGCTNECAANVCVLGMLRACGNLDADPCLELGSAVACAASDPCTVPSCSASGTECAVVPRTCNTQPAPSCASSTAVRAYAETGTCERGGCVYAAHDLPCDTPPAPHCEGDERVFAEALGTCVDAVCTYPPRRETCAFGCEDGQCRGDPCGSVTCTTPPAATCATPNTMRTYAATGTCAAGTCSYAETDAICAGGCTAGACEAPRGTWSTLPLAGAPAGRYTAKAVWTGSEMIVWGGVQATGAGIVRYDDGGRFDPRTSAWTALPSSGLAGRNGHVMVWTGREVIVWGGLGSSGYLATGARFDPATNAWTPMTTTGAPTARAAAAGVWTGTHLLVWGGSTSTTSFLNDGARYDPATNTWTPISSAGAPTARELHAAVWTGSEMIVWGGRDGSGFLGTGGRYVTATNTWLPMTSTGAPSPRLLHATVWTGSEMLVWGGYLAPGFTYYGDGARFDPVAGTWRAMPAAGAPAGRSSAAVVWTGAEMIVWGGIAGGLFTTTGARFDPAASRWAALSTDGAPAGREHEVAVWTGTEMLVWGGSSAGAGRNDGGRFTP